MSNIQQEQQHITCNLASSYSLFNSNKSSFVSAAFYLAELSPATTHQSEKTLGHGSILFTVSAPLTWSKSKLLGPLLTLFWFWCTFRCWTSFCWQAKPPVIAGQNTNTSLCCSCSSSLQQVHVVLRNLCESQNWGWAFRGCQRENKDIFSFKNELVSPKWLFGATK